MTGHIVARHGAAGLSPAGPGAAGGGRVAAW
jgi:hypothetical protein